MCKYRCYKNLSDHDWSNQRYAEFTIHQIGVIPNSRLVKLHFFARFTAYEKIFYTYINPPKLCKVSL